jgi:hypothetical protein
VIEDELVAHRPGDAFQHGCGERELPGLRGNVGLPADPGQRVAVAIQKADAGVGGFFGVVRARLQRIVEQFRREFSAAIGNVD